MNILVVVLIAAVLGGLYLALRRRGGTSQAERVAGIELKDVRGIVTGVGRHSETVVSGQGSGIHGGPVSMDIRSESVLHQSFFLRREDGVEEPVRMWGYDVPLAEGHAVTLIRAERGARSRPAILVNHNARRAWPLYRDAAEVGEQINVMLKPLGLIVLALVLAMAGGYLLNEIVLSNSERQPLWLVAAPIFVALWLALFVHRRARAAMLNRALKRRAEAILAEESATRQPRG